MNDAADPDAELRHQAVAAMRRARRPGPEPRQHRQPEPATAGWRLLDHAHRHGRPSDLSADDLVWLGRRRPRAAGAWRTVERVAFPPGDLRARGPTCSAVVHAHSGHATALACLRRELPAFHYMVAVAGGDSVPCTPYHLFGTEALSQAVATAFGHRQACLMANHGLVAAGLDAGAGDEGGGRGRGAVRASTCRRWRWASRRCCRPSRWPR